MTKKVKFTLISIACIAILIFGIWGIIPETGIPRIPIDRGFTLEAQSNPLLAAEKFLQKEGRNVESRSGLSLLDHLPATSDILIISGSRLHIGERRYQQLLDWIQSGGAIVVSGRALFDEEKGKSGDLLLDRLNIRKYQIEEDSEEEEAFSEENQEESDEADFEQVKQEIIESLDDITSGEKNDYCSSEKIDTDRILTIQLERQTDPVQLLYSPDYYITQILDSGSEELENRKREQIIQFKHGKGEITVLSHDYFWYNRYICQLDHAFFLKFLTNERAKVWLLFQRESPSLLVVFWQKSPFVILSFLALGILLLWRNAFRIGPVLDFIEKDRRQLSEHLMALGRYLWQYHLINSNLELIQQSINKSMEKAFPGFSENSLEDQAQQMATLSGLSVEEIKFAFSPKTKQKKNEVFRKVQILQQIQRSL